MQYRRHIQQNSLRLLQINKVIEKKRESFIILILTVIDFGVIHFIHISDVLRENYFVRVLHKKEKLRNHLATDKSNT